MQFRTPACAPIRSWCDTTAWSPWSAAQSQSRGLIAAPELRWRAASTRSPGASSSPRVRPFSLLHLHPHCRESHSFTILIPSTAAARPARHLYPTPVILFGLGEPCLLSLLLARPTFTHPPYCRDRPHTALLRDHLTCHDRITPLRG
jgi:hypothetical protein